MGSRNFFGDKNRKNNKRDKTVKKYGYGGTTGRSSIRSRSKKLNPPIQSTGDWFLSQCSCPDETFCSTVTTTKTRVVATCQNSLTGEQVDTQVYDCGTNCVECIGELFPSCDPNPSLMMGECETACENLNPLNDWGGWQDDGGACWTSEPGSYLYCCVHQCGGMACNGVTC